MKTSLREGIIDMVGPGSSKRSEHSLCQECNNVFYYKHNTAIAKRTRGSGVMEAFRNWML